ncbi:hypothetical protein ACFVZH_08950 [Streptomyces sp. NPDC059534]|uniref:hypothetical protein n=1 Tax=Streptomyces sp. NPDC059534 TaxID=3346859 RepID=UPI003681C2C7
MRKEAGAAPAGGLAGSLLREVAAEPGRLPESLASFALRRMGPGAGKAVERLRAAHPDADAAALRALIVTRGRRAVTAEGAFVGGPFMLFIPVAFCGALLSQARMIFELAAAEGRDATDPERAAELLVLQGVYEDTAAARAALTAAPSRTRRPETRGRWAALWGLVIRMARLLGLLTPATDGPGKLVRIFQIALSCLVFLVGLVAPLVWLPYLAVMYWRATTRLTGRATVFYVGSPDLRVPRGVRVDAAMGLALLRALASLLVPAVAVFLVVTSDLRIAGGRWPVLGMVLTASCLFTGGWWLWRRHRRRPTP